MIEPKEIKAISKEHIHEWLAKLHEFQIFAPVRRENYSEFTLISDSNEIDLELQNAILSPKEHIFAQARSMFKFDAKDLNEGSQIECDDFTKTPKHLMRSSKIHITLVFERILTLLL